MSQPKVSKSSIFAIIAGVIVVLLVCAAANRALVAAGLTPAERAEWDYKTAVGVAQALAESKVSWVPSVMFGGGSSSNSAMDAVGLKMLLDITKSLDKTNK